MMKANLRWPLITIYAPIGCCCVMLLLICIKIVTSPKNVVVAGIHHLSLKMNGILWLQITDSVNAPYQQHTHNFNLYYISINHLFYEASVPLFESQGH